MPSSSVLLTFACVTLVVLAVPGPSVVYVVSRSVERGPRAGLWSVLGLETGLLVHVLASAAGLSAIVASGWGLELLRWAGVAYLAHLALRQFGWQWWPPSGRRPARATRAATPTADEAAGPAPSMPTGSHVELRRGTLFRDGFLVDLLNPKTCLFFLAFLPQFVDPSATTPALQLLVLGLVVVPVAALCDGAYVLLAGVLRSYWRGAAGAGRRVDLATGGVYLLLGATAALA